jgi:hypothetical protein
VSYARAPGRSGRRVRLGLVTSAQGLVLGLLSFVGGLSLFILTTLSIAFIALGVGVLLVPFFMVAVRLLANERRRLVQQWSRGGDPGAVRAPAAVRAVRGGRVLAALPMAC